MLGIPGLVVAEEHQVARAGDVFVFLKQMIAAQQPLVAPVRTVALAVDEAAPLDEPVSPGVLAAVVGIDHIEQVGAVALVHLVHAPADELGAPFSVGVSAPQAIFGEAVRPLGIAQLAPRHLQQLFHKIRPCAFLDAGFPLLARIIHIRNGIYLFRRNGRGGRVRRRGSLFLGGKNFLVQVLVGGTPGTGRGQQQHRQQHG